MTEETKRARATTTDGVEVFCGFDKLINPRDLLPHPMNPNTHSPEQIALLADIIRKSGWRAPVTVSTRSNLIIKGHGRVLAALYGAIQECPVDFQHYDTEGDELADLVADNRLAELAEINKMQLAQVFQQIDPEALARTGYTEEEANEITDLLNDIDLATETADDLVPAAEVDEPAITQPGDVWILGRHKLICGDSTKAATYKALLGDELAQLILTDPPYNVDYTGKSKEAMKIKNDKMEREEFVNFLTKAFENFKNHSAPGAPFYIWHASIKGLHFKEAVLRAGMQVRQVLIWVKNCIVLGRQDYQWQHEPAIYGWVDGAAHHFIDDRKLSTVMMQPPLEPEKMAKKDLVELVKNYIQPHDETHSSILYEKKPARADLHPTMKPVKLFEKLILNSSKKGWLVLDPFGGSGTTIIAAELTGRIARSIELDPHYADVIVRRYIATTGAERVECIRNGRALDQEAIADIYEIDENEE